jgi:polyhydroxyalkanoate synthase
MPVPAVLPTIDQSRGADPWEGPSQLLDRATGAALAQLTGGLSPASLAAAFQDWASHVALSPGRQLRLGAKAARDWLRFLDYARQMALAGDDAPVCITPQPQDQRFRDDAWRHWPFNLLQQSFLLSQHWWDAATRDVAGVTPHHEDVVRFMGRQILDMLAPTNFILTNPVVQRRVGETGGQCLLDGMNRLAEDVWRFVSHEAPAGADQFKPGVDVAKTPGIVVFRNALIELIRYTPTTASVRPEPLLIVPAWIMKYYILDLSAENSLVRFLVDQGFTIFMISWRNPGIEQRDTSFDDYRRHGVMAALDAIRAITGAPKVHAAGYCLGGTLLAIAAATMAREKDDRIATITLLAAQTEFSEPGELGLFIDDAQLAYLDNLMWAQGYLNSSQMGGAFQMLRSNDLIWSRVVRGYLMGEPAPVSDLMAWNADGTRMPQAMHSQYLRQLFLDDDLAEGRFLVDGRTIALEDLHQPFFVVGTERDHVAPWRSVHKIHLLTEAEVTFVLTSGGHNAGIVSEPGHAGRAYHIHTRPAEAPHIDCDAWLAAAEHRDGSWWLAWVDWLKDRSGEPVAAPSAQDVEQSGAALGAAPGRYVLEH